MPQGSLRRSKGSSMGAQGRRKGRFNQAPEGAQGRHNLKDVLICFQSLTRCEILQFWFSLFRGSPKDRSVVPFRKPKYPTLLGPQCPSPEETILKEQTTLIILKAQSVRPILCWKQRTLDPYNSESTELPILTIMTAQNSRSSLF